MSKVDSMHVTDHVQNYARIGPNAIIQTVHALYDSYGEQQAAALLQQGGQAHLIDNLPTEMIDEAAFHSLVHTLVVQTGAEQARMLLHDAGQRTAQYLLKHRIPSFFQRLVRLLPPRPGFKLLFWGIGKHAWTFVGSGTFHFQANHHPTIHVRVTYPSDSAVAQFYGGTFTHLMHALIDQRITVQTNTSNSAGAIDCTYTLTLYEGQPV
jgi:divinyl protochlorophyllide a 8-vinyl-reductase